MFSQQLMRRALIVANLAWATVGATAPAQQPPVRPYDGIQAGLDAYRLAEAQRQAGFSQQLFLNDQLRFWNGLPTSGAQAAYGYGSPVYYGYAPSTAALGPAAPNSPQANLDYAYAYGATRPLGAVVSPWGGLSVFEPWPYVAGNIYGYPYVPQPARQPLVQQQMQTGQSRWESHPVYAPPVTQYQPPPPVDAPQLEQTPYAAPAPPVPPAAPPPSLSSTGSTTDPVPPAPPAPPRPRPRER